MSFRAADPTSARKTMRYWKRLCSLLADVGVALGVLAVVVAAYRFGVMRLVEHALPASDLLVPLLRRGGVVLSALGAYWVVARYFERRPLSELAVEPGPVALGFLSGVAVIGVTIGSLYALGAYELVAVRGAGPALSIMATIILTVIFEEIVFRGVFFRLLEKHVGTLRALGFQAVLFGALHLFNQATTPLTIVSVTLIGLFWTLIYVYTRSLWVLIAHHAAWNLTIFVAGVPLSGLEKWLPSAPLETVRSGPWWLTGGGFGPEDSVLNVVVVMCALTWIGVRTRRRKALLRGAWAEGKLSA